MCAALSATAHTFCHMARERIEDIGLAVGQYDELNRQFFTGQHAPHVFLRHRLQGALLMGDGGEQVQAAVQAALDRGVTVGELAARGDMRPDDATDEDRALFSALEAIVLFHHAAETLLRLLLALENDELCPWLEVTRLRYPGAYPTALRDLRTRLLEPATQDNLAKVFYHRRDRHTPFVRDGNMDELDSAMKGLTMLIAECCEKLDSEASLYNSAKHGLSAVPGNAAMQFQQQGDPDNPILKAGDHPSITLLEAVPSEDAGRKQWQQTTHWIRADRRLALTHMVIEQIENLWNVAHLRYVDPQGTRHLKLLHRDAISSVLKTPTSEDGPGYEITVMSIGMPLLYVVETPEIKRRIEAAAQRNRRRK